MTAFAKKRLKRAIQLLVASSQEKEAIHFKTGKTFKFRVNFITLTLPAAQGDITDKDLKKKCLDVWIKRMKRKFKLNNYVWRAEKQKNGNLHFHFVTDTYLHYEKIRNDWNSCLQAFDFIDRFEQKHGHRNPNSTDVHAVHQVNDLAAYMVKYMSKDDPEVKKIEGKLWDCSKALKTKQNCEMLLENEAQQIFEAARTDTNVRFKDTEVYSCIFFNKAQFSYYITGRLRGMWEEYLRTIREGNPPDIPLQPHDPCTLRAA